MIHMDFLFKDRSLGIIFEYTGKHLMQLHYWKVKCISLYEDPQFVFYMITPVLSFSEPTSSQAFRRFHVLNCCMVI